MNNVFMRISTSIIHQRFIWIQNKTSSTIIFLIWICWCAHINYVVHIVLNNNNNRNAQSALNYRCTHLRVQSVCKVRQKNLLHLLGIWGSCALLSILGFPHFKCHWAEREREREIPPPESFGSQHVETKRQHNRDPAPPYHAMQWTVRTGHYNVLPN